MSEEDKYREHNLNYLQSLKDKNVNPYPHTFKPTISFEDYITKYNTLTDGEHLHSENNMCSLTGRVILKRSAGKLYFYTVESDNCRIQFMNNYSFSEFYDVEDPGNSNSIAKFKEQNNSINRGDIIGAIGFPGKSKKGELSLFIVTLIRLTPCIRMLPTEHFGLTDPEARFRNRPLDMIMNSRVRETLETRSLIITNIRDFFVQRNFTEVQTPILWPCAGGASAKPFKTSHNDLGIDVFMRIAPELFLKELVIGGMNKVFELGQQFRNESIDCTHNPEFTSLESYEAYADYVSLMNMCEDLFSSIVYSINKSYVVKYTPMGSSKELEIDFTPPYKRIDMISELQEKTGVTFPDDLTTDETRLFFVDLCNKVNVPCPQPHTTARLIDRLVGHYIESEHTNPIFIMNHPLVMSPLAKWNRTNSQLTERFEFFAAGMELANAYTELNDPVVQQQRFDLQNKDKALGDVEAQTTNGDFVRSLEYGLPPTGGYGMGIDRFVMLLTNNNSIRDVLAFPIMAPIKNV